MADSVSTVVLKLKDQASRQLEKTTQESDKLASSLEKVTRAGQGMLTWGGRLTAGVTAPILGIVTAVIGLANRVGNLGDDLLTLEATTGLSTDQLQAMGYAADQSGSSLDAIAAGAVTLTRRLKEGGDQAKDFQSVLSILGVSAADSTGKLRPMSELMPEIINRLQGVEDGTTRNSLAMQLFGGSAAELAPLLSITSSEMLSLTNEASDLGLVLDRDALANAEAFGDELSTLRAQLGATANKLALDLVPTARSLVDVFRASVVPVIVSVSNKIKGAIDWWNGLSESQRRIVGTVIAVLAVLPPLVTAIGGVISVVTTLRTVLLGLQAVMAALSGNWVVALIAVVVGLAAALGIGQLGRGANEGAAALENLKGKMQGVEGASNNVRDAVASKDKNSLISGLMLMKEYVDVDLSKAIDDYIQLLIEAGDKAVEFYGLNSQLIQLGRLSTEIETDRFRLNDLTLNILPKLNLQKGEAESYAQDVLTQVGSALRREGFGSREVLNAISFDRDSLSFSYDFGDFVPSDDEVRAVLEQVGWANSELASRFNVANQSLQSASSEVSALTQRIESNQAEYDSLFATVNDSVRTGRQTYGANGRLGATGTPEAKAADELARQETETANYVTRKVYDAVHASGDRNKAIADTIKELKAQDEKLDAQLGEAIASGNFDWAASVQARRDKVRSGIRQLQDELPKVEDVKEIDALTDSLKVITEQATNGVIDFGDALRSLNQGRAGMQSALDDAISRGDPKDISRFSEYLGLYDDAIAKALKGASSPSKPIPAQALESDYTRELVQLIQIREADGETVDWFYEKWEALAERYRDKSFEELGTDDPVSRMLQSVLESTRKRNKEVADSSAETQRTAEQALQVGRDRQRIFDNWRAEQAALDDDFARGINGVTSEMERNQRLAEINRRAYAAARDTLGANDELTLQLAQLVQPDPKVNKELEEVSQARTRLNEQYSSRLRELEGQLASGSVTQAQYQKAIFDLTVDMFESASAALGIDDAFTVGWHMKMDSEAPERALAQAAAAREQLTKSLNEALAEIAARDAAGLFKDANEKAEAIRQANSNAFLSAVGSLGIDDELTQSLLTQVLADNAAREREVLDAAKSQVLEDRRKQLAQIDGLLAAGLITPDVADSRRRDAFKNAVIAGIGLGDESFTSDLLDEYRSEFPEDEIVAGLLDTLEKARASIQLKVQAHLLTHAEGDAEYAQALNEFLLGYLAANPDIDLDTDEIYNSVTNQLNELRDKIRFQELKSIAAGELLNGLWDENADAAVVRATQKVSDLSEGLEIAKRLFGENSAQVGVFELALRLAQKSLADLKAEAAKRAKVEAIQKVQDKVLEVANDLKDVFAGLFPDDEKVAGFFDTIISGANDAFDMLKNLASGNIFGAVAAAVKGGINLIRGLINLFTPAWKKVSAEIQKNVQAGVLSGLASAVRDYVSGASSLEDFGKAVQRAVYSSVLDGIVNAIIQAALIEGVLKDTLKKISDAAAKSQWDVIPDLVKQAAAITRDAMNQLTPALTGLRNEFSGILSDAKDVNDDTEELAQWGQFMSQAISIPFYDATLRFDNSVSTFSGAVSRLVDEGISVQSRVTVNGQEPYAPAY